MTSTMLTSGGAELCAETFGRPGDPAVLLISGAASSMDCWRPDFCALLADAGRHVVRYDHRDTGQSSVSPVGRPDYTGADLSRDALGVLDGLGIGAAHLVGVSMGGAIAQETAAQHPDRVLSLTLVATTCALPRAHPTPLPPPEARVAETFTTDAPPVDWSDADAAVSAHIEALRPYAGGLGLDEEEMRAMSREVVARTRDLAASVTNHWLVVGDGEPSRHTMADVHAPTLVLHGTDDPLFPFQHGEALAAEIEGARLLPLPGMGHEVPPRVLWPTVVPAIVEHTGG